MPYWPSRGPPSDAKVALPRGAHARVLSPTTLADATLFRLVAGAVRRRIILEDLSLEMARQGLAPRNCPPCCDRLRRDTLRLAANFSYVSTENSKFLRCFTNNCFNAECSTELCMLYFLRIACIQVARFHFASLPVHDAAEFYERSLQVYIVCWLNDYKVKRRIEELITRN